MATRKVKRFYDGGDTGYGGETGGGANAPGTGGNIPGGGYDGGGDNSNLTSRRVLEGETTSRFPGAPSNAPPGYFGRVTIPSEESAEYSNAMRDVGALNTRGALSARDRLEARSDAGSFAAPGFGDLGQFAGSFAEGADGRAKGGMMKKYAKGGIMDTKKLKQKDIFTKEMGDEMGGPPKNNDMGSAYPKSDMGSATKPPKQGMGAGAGRGKQGGPTAKELADYSRKQERKRSGDRVFMAEDGQPPMDPEDAYAKGGMAGDKGKHKMPDGKTMKNSAMVKKYAKGGMVSSASSRGDGMAVRGKTRGRLC